MRYVRIFLYYFENVFQYRSQIFVWFLISLFHPLIYLLYWRGSSQVFSSVTYYYLFYIVAGGLLYVHVDVDAYEDIQQGQLSVYLMKPETYLVFKFLDELPWRIIQGMFGFVTLSIILLMTGLEIPWLSFSQLLIAIVVMCLGYLIMFLFKMIILISALWITDIGGLLQLSDMIIIIFAGFIMPIHLFPKWFADFVYLTPLPYTIYYAVISFMGKVQVSEFPKLILTQISWVIIFYLLYQILWRRGLKKFTAVGQ